ncbi:MAG: hypothetical protein ABI779_00210 [Acidobacteriota bacterium]
MNKEQQNIADVMFILEAVDRFYLMTPQEVIAHISQHSQDTFATLSLTKGGHLFCGREAYDRFNEIADRTIKPGSDEDKAYDRGSYVRALRSSFVETFVEGGTSISQSSVTKFVNQAKHLATARLVEVTRHIPCIVFYDKEPAVFSVGPVKFRTREAFFAESSQALSDFVNAEREAFANGSAKRRSDLSQEAAAAEADAFAATVDRKIREFYGDYGWVGSVEVPKSHASVSKRRAERTIDAALDVLRLFVPSTPERLGRATSPRAPYETHELSSNAGGRFFASMHQGGRGASAGEHWYEEIQRHTPHLWKLFGDAIDPIRSDTKPDELNQRLLDALNWFGQGIVEPNTAAAIIKYTAALERLTMTGHVAGIEDVVIRRVLFLNFQRTDKTPADVESDIGDLYQTRSDLMHGSQSPYDPKLERILRLAWQVSRCAILEAAQLFALLRAEGKANRKALAAMYDRGRVKHDESAGA